MKKLFSHARNLSFLLIVLLLLSSCGSGKSSNEQPQTVDDSPEPVSEPETFFNLGDTVSTDIAEITVNKAEFSTYAYGCTYSSNGTVVNVEEACEPNNDDPSSHFAAGKGRSLICIKFELKNTDRVDLNTVGTEIASFSVTQGDKFFPVNNYSLNYPDGTTMWCFEITSMAYSIDGSPLTHSRASNIILPPEKTADIRFIGVVGFEPDITAPFDLTVSLLNSSGEHENFTYSVK